MVWDLVCLLFNFSDLYKHGFGSVLPLSPPDFFYSVPVCRKSFTTGWHCLIVLNICNSEALKKLSSDSLDFWFWIKAQFSYEIPNFNVVRFDSTKPALIFNLVFQTDWSRTLMVHCSCRECKLILFAFLILKSLLKMCHFRITYGSLLTHVWINC